MHLQAVHHIAIICSDYEASKAFYTDLLGFTIIREVYREDRDSYKLDLALNGTYIIELFSFPEAPERASYPEARGLRHLAFEVENLEETVAELHQSGIQVEDIRIDPYTSKRFTFFSDPDGLPLELYEI
ncbi:SMU1112c/YaeR family gloxylase I-like metalloprotein [Rossellomorea marisflavi]|uniref:SMU1112c/YaeR family gloxylase I-like metalloprotein n=1 Tax=Rossellomorea marisflavi TaxID=189381 RepID=UPI00203DA15B|nr:VOC family protein [Rossellomorea marisflavi]MCM2590287.1 VOC family protein [Rossellomorea marisflavi]